MNPADKKLVGYSFFAERLYKIRKRHVLHELEVQGEKTADSGVVSFVKKFAKILKDGKYNLDLNTDETAFFRNVYIWNFGI